MSSIEGGTVLITGGASGIGFLMGRLVLERGAARLVIWDMRADALAEAEAALRTPGRSVVGFAVDITDPEQVRRALAEMDRQGLAVDVLVNNAGIVVGKSFAEHSDADIERTMQVNATAPMRLARALLPGMLARRRGHVVNIASAAGMVANPGMSVYCASKFAMVGWSESLRIELERAGSGVRVTTVTPFYIDTGMFAGVRSPVLPILKPDYAARMIVDAVARGRILLRMPRLLYLVPLVQGLLPTRWFDVVCGRWFGIHDSMATFKGRGG